MWQGLLADMACQAEGKPKITLCIEKLKPYEFQQKKLRTPPLSPTPLFSDLTLQTGSQGLPGQPHQLCLRNVLSTLLHVGNPLIRLLLFSLLILEMRGVLQSQ